MGESTPTKPKRELVLARFKEKYPDKEYKDDDEIYSQTLDDFDSYDNEINDYRNREQSLLDMFDSDPRSAALLVGIKNGEDPAVGLMRRFGPELRDILDDPERQEELAEAQKEYLERITQERELDELYKENFEKSTRVIEEFQQSHGMSDDEIDALIGRIVAVANDMVVGKFDASTLELFSKANNYDGAVADARAEGEVAGRNARITERLRHSQKGDGTIPLGGSPTGSRRDDGASLGALDRYDSPDNSIWSKGGMKRITHK